jgi:hypothetical protein
MATNQGPGAYQGLQDRELQERMADADLVVVGKVSGIRAMPESQARGPISHKNPLLQIATIDVESVEKGTQPQKKVDVVYSSSKDIAWYRSWKPEIGQVGIWFLKGAQKQGVGVLGVDTALVQGAYSALKPGDYQPPDQLDRIRSLK